MTSIAKQSEFLDKKRFHHVVCAPGFKKEIDKTLGNKGCVPQKCGRAVWDGLLSDAEVLGLLEIAKKGIAKGGGTGGASILDLHSGALSKGEGFIDLYKTHPDLFDDQEFEVYR